MVHFYIILKAQCHVYDIITAWCHFCVLSELHCTSHNIIHAAVLRVLYNLDVRHSMKMIYLYKLSLGLIGHVPL